MNRKDAIEILGKEVVSDDGGLFNPLNYLGWNTCRDTATLDGEFTAKELEAIAWWMKEYIEVN